ITMTNAGKLSGKNVQVLLRKGVYEFGKTLTLSNIGHANQPASVTWKNYGQEKVECIGGSAIKGFTALNDVDYIKHINPNYRQHILEFDLKQNNISTYGITGNRRRPGMEFFFNGKRMQSARWPNVGYDTIVSVPQTGETMFEGYVTRLDAEGLPKGRHYGRFQYKGDRPDDWSHPGDIFLHGFWVFTWADEIVGVESIDKNKKEITLRQPHSRYGYSKGGVYYAMNVLEELDQPGEWYLDQKKGKLLFWPPSPIKDASAFVSLLDSAMLVLDNTRNVKIQGITFSNSRGNAIIVKEGENNLIAGCEFKNLGDIAILVNGGRKNGVSGCNLYDLAAGGILLRGGDRKSLTSAGNFVTNTHIHHFGQWLKAHQSAITLGGVGNYIAHNLIHHGPGTGIMLSGNEHLLEYNELHHLGQQMADVGAFYMGRNWTQRGNIVRYNFFHDLSGPGKNYVNAVYLDDFSSGTVVHGNIFLRCATGIEIGGGRDNEVSNNIFIENNLGISVDARGIGWAKYFFEGKDSTLFKGMEAMNYTQPPYSTKYPILLNLYQDEPALPKGNRIVNNISYKEPWLRLLYGIDLNMILAKDNLISDPEGVYNNDKDFIVKGNPGILEYNNGAKIKLSPKAYAHGFKKIPFEKIGLKKDTYRPTLGR
ncbi:MAG TPA: right-handed parallel beta-helix repeat-containing protein, partial [Agriterribacter sp.]|nr:right-handed parallel beta-helix repeat-containing protein [Agriterribacter sp.]